MSDLQIKIEKCEVFVVDCYDFDRLVKQVYGRNYDYIAQEEANNDSCKLYQDISGELDEFETDEINNFKESGNSCSAGVLLNDLCKNKHIEPGNYLIKISW